MAEKLYIGSPEKIFFHARHTHSGPSAKMRPANGIYKPTLRDTILSADEYVAFAAPIIAQNLVNARSKAQQTFLVQLAAGASIHAGYLPSPDAEKFGGYGGLIINGQCDHHGGYKLADITVEEINKLF